MENLVCGIDIETTGLDIKKDEITEIAWVIKPWRDPKPLVMRTEFCLVAQDISPEITNLTGITSEHVGMGKPLRAVLESLFDDLLTYPVNYILAHNGTNFDKPWVLDALGLNRPAWFDDLLWLDSAKDIRWPFPTAKLNYLAAELGFLNPFPHAALFDVMTMFRVAETRELSEIVKMATTPDMVVEACVTFGTKDMAKDKKYRWQDPGNGKTYTKKWVKLIKEDEFDEEARSCLFPIRRVYD